LRKICPTLLAGDPAAPGGKRPDIESWLSCQECFGNKRRAPEASVSVFNTPEKMTICGGSVARVIEGEQRRMKPKHPVPKTLQGWLTEIATAYNDASRTLPLAELMGQKASEKDLFQLAPPICLKLRGLPRTKKLEAKATEAASSTYVATQSQRPEALTNPHIYQK